MLKTVATDASPASILRRLRGAIVAARIVYPDILHVEVRDTAGALWRLATQDADFSPADPGLLLGREIEDAEIDGTTGALRCRLSDGSSLDVRPAGHGAREDPPSWELIAPDDLALEVGPGLRWQIASATHDSR